MIDYAKQNPTLAVVEEVVRELANAREFFPKPFASAHEGYAILKEEVDELWADVKMSQLGHPEHLRHRNDCMRKEAIQVAAMAVRFVIDVCDA